jgi:FkbM family methyltransferase
LKERKGGKDQDNNISRRETMQIKKILKNAKLCFLSRKHIKNWLPLIIQGGRINELKLARLENLNLLFRMGTGDLPIMVEVLVFGNYHKYFPFNKTVKIIDIGAHNGYFSIWSSVNTNNQSEIFAYEPVPANYEIALSNIKNNNISNIKLYNKGVSGGREELILYFNEQHTGGHSIYKERVLKCNAKAISEIGMECITLEDVFNENVIKNCDFCKMDCEGAEFDILLNTPSNILQKVDVFSIEFHEFGGHKVDELVNLFDENNFRVEFSYSPSSLGIKYGMLYAKGI